MTQTLTRDNITDYLDRTYAGVEDLTLPSREEINLLFSRFARFGVLTSHPSRPNGFSLVLEGESKSTVFKTRTSAWDFYLRNRDRLEAIALERACPF
jgi:hypothetical protein